MNAELEPLHIFPAFSYRDRLCGLHAYPELTGHRGLWLRPCKAIHTFGLAYAIDAVFLDQDLRSLKCVENMAPNRIAWCLGARSVVELPGGYCARNSRGVQWLRHALLQSGLFAP